MNGELLDQTFHVQPARRSQGFEVNVNTTSTVYSVGNLSWGEVAWDELASNKYLYLRLTAEDGKVYYRFQPGADTDMDPTNAIAVAGTPSLQASYCEPIPANNYVDVRIDRVIDRYISLATDSGTARCRVGLSSQPNR